MRYILYTIYYIAPNGANHKHCTIWKLYLRRWKGGGCNCFLMVAVHWFYFHSQNIHFHFLIYYFSCLMFIFHFPIFNIHILMFHCHFIIFYLYFLIFHFYCLKFYFHFLMFQRYDLRKFPSGWMRNCTSLFDGWGVDGGWWIAFEIPPLLYFTPPQTPPPPSCSPKTLN